MRDRMPHADVRRPLATNQAFLRALPALKVLEERLCDAGLKVADLATAAFVSEVRLRALFREVVGASPVAHLQQRRIDRACRLLRGSPDTVESIAQQCGFESTQFFNRVFKKLKGTTPSAFRSAPEW